MHDGPSRPTPRGPLTYRCAAFDTLTEREVHDLLALRSEIFVVEQACVFLDPDGRDPLAWHVLGHDVHGVLGGAARVFVASEARDAHVIGRVVVHAALRGTGEGRALVQAAIELAEGHAPAPIELSAQAHLARFYGSFGFVAISAPYVLDGIDHLDMRRAPPSRHISRGSV